MSYLALYRKYRPQKFDDFFGQKYIVNILKKSIENNKISHAYLFSGPRGTGKTSMAKLIAKVINCSNLAGTTACEKCDSCVLFNEKSNPDVIEIDAASNNGVDEIRLLREKVSLTPSVSRYKVYIIDEVHMLTISAFNALLKTLEEPPEHVVFILATTELYKVPDTIVSRCQSFEFEQISESEITKSLKNIVKREKIDVDKEVFDLISKYSKGGLRDAIGILDKLSASSDKITPNVFYDVVGVAPEEDIVVFLAYIRNKDVKNSIMKLETMEKSGKNIEYFVEQIMNYLKNSIVSGGNSVDSVDEYILEELSLILNDMKYAFNYLLTLEVGILKIINSIHDDKIISREIISGGEDENKGQKKLVEADSSEIMNTSIEKENPEKNEQMVVDDIGINNAFALADKKLKNEMLKKWKNFNDYVHNKEFSSIVSYFLDSNLEVAGKEDVIISVDNDATVQNAIFNKVKLELLFNLVIGNVYNLVFVTNECFENLKNKYIEDIKKGKKYEYINKIEKKNDIIEEDVAVSKSFEYAKEVFGSDIVESK